MLIVLVIGMSGSALAAPKVALILDDVGYRLTDAQALALPAQVAFSILPDTPQSRILSERAHAQGRDILLHMPMEADSGKLLGPRGLTADMQAPNIQATLEGALDSVPYAIGVNNHMGSKLTRQAEPMMALMQTLKHRDLFFIDSRTTAQTVAERTAREFGLPTARRHVFIDHQHSPEFMQHQFNLLVNLARKQGYAIGIAHPHPKSVQFLIGALQQLPSLEVQLVPVSQLFQKAQEPGSPKVLPDNQAIAPE